MTARHFITPRNVIASQPDRTISSSDLREAMRSFPTGVAVITTTDDSGDPVGLTVNSLCSVSMRPPMILWCLREESATRSAFTHNVGFTVNILAADQAALATRFASHPGDRFAGIAWRTGPAKLPLLERTSAWLVCRRSRPPLHTGDHLVLLGQVVDSGRSELNPLVFSGGGYRELGTT